MDGLHMEPGILSRPAPLSPESARPWHESDLERTSGRRAQACEEMYEEMAEAMGVDYKNEDPVVCDLADPEFIEAYFKYLHHPREEEGVDFWWIDWQQGGVSKVEGLDPLWILNHYHFLDIGSERETTDDIFEVCRTRQPALSGRVLGRHADNMGIL